MIMLLFLRVLDEIYQGLGVTNMRRRLVLFTLDTQ